MKKDYTKCSDKTCNGHTEMVMEYKDSDKIKRRWACTKCYKIDTEIVNR